ncbi:glycosyltransferase [Pseudoclavibacter sp. CFCC 14310]|uniref:glycosyltransferase n=1 Tax=Pseudoclavibacter sp. CFCC 14310 TaxID=2615180 RepID=UPI0013014E27|nr:glycosyltransferase [Pseudoclavibacter sp. CFCC 14310]KAB1647030.1 glycosyltransferase [Pseudoclavibacter sp. CFCC 14310]
MESQEVPLDVSGFSIAAIVPCHNEEAAIRKVVLDLKAAVPTMDIYVYDNRSTDNTAEIAAEAGAIVRHEYTKGKGNVVRRAFADIDADIYVLIDGDDTYGTDALPSMIQTLLSGPYDHVLGVRKETTQSAYRSGHSLGNRAFNWLVSSLFKSQVTDMLSGYRVFSRRFVKSFPAVSKEFEIETELTVHYLSLRIPHVEVPVGFKDRAEGTESKLHTFRDGFKILRLITDLVRHERPMAFHGLLGALVALVGVALGVPILNEFMETGLVPRLPTAVLASSLATLGVMIWTVGLVLDGITRNRHENARLVYLALPSVEPRVQESE